MEHRAETNVGPMTFWRTGPGQVQYWKTMLALYRKYNVGTIMAGHEWISNQKRTFTKMAQ